MTDGTERHEDRIRTFLAQCMRHPAPLDLEDRVLNRLRRRRLWLAPFITGTVGVVAAAAVAVVAFAAHTPPAASLPPGPAATSPRSSASPSSVEATTPPVTSQPTSVPVTQAPAATSHLALSGALVGELTDIRSTCGLHQVVNNGHNFDSPYVQAVGLLNGHSVQVTVYDPASFGSWEQAAHVIVTQFESRSTVLSGSYGSWIVQSPAGVSGFNLSTGTRIQVIVQPDAQGSSTTPTRPLTLNGAVVC